jgi:hypothetical protein
MLRKHIIITYHYQATRKGNRPSSEALPLRHDISSGTAQGTKIARSWRIVLQQEHIDIQAGKERSAAIAS